MGLTDVFGLRCGLLQTELSHIICAKNARIDRMPSRLPPLNALRAFEAAGRHESFTRAAEELGVAHSSISRHVRGLEDRLGAQLFKETSRGVTLTQAGHAYLADIRPAFEVIAEATERFSDQPAGVVNVSCDPSFAIHWLIPALGDFETRFPEVELRIQGTSELANIERFEADLAIRFLRSGWMEGPNDLLSDAPMTVYASPDLIAEPVTDPEEFLQYRLLKDRDGDPWREWFVAAGLAEDKIPEPGWRLRALLAYQYAIFGHGVLLASADFIGRDIEAGRLIQVHPTALPSGTINLLAGPGALRRRAVASFRTWLIELTAPLRGGNSQPNG